MDYHFENLGDERFQKLCQATVAAKFPNVQSFPVGQADGGRDAVSAHDGGFIVFQVKYSETYRGREARAIVNSVIKSESAKVRKLISRGATSYYFLTNIEGSATLDTGTIDQVNDLLTQEFGIPSYCWWRNDIERLVETIPGLVWRYPEMLRATDFLEILANNSAHHGSKKTYDVFRLYMASQFVKEADVKFQQVQIQSKLAEIFTDTPLALARDKQPDIENLYCESAILPSAIELLRNNRYYFHGGSTYFAADWLARSGPTHGVQRLVLEGAPGQGKSTVTQYLCQLHRGRSLGKPVKVNGNDPSLDLVLRLPIRIDLRDYATWLSGSDPFANQKLVARPVDSSDAMEELVAHQIRHLSGRSFNTDDLAIVLEDANLLIVLDGFDEVADILTRTKMIEQVRLFCGRLETAVKSAQVIVTSRPSAFILSKGFSESEWFHYSLRPLEIKQIEEYANKWIKAKTFDGREGIEFRQLLLDRVERPHIRSLAQNPMQLAILLNLISTKGRSLPDKRTALYDSYIDLFFGREAEKDETVRENRDVLIQIHQHLAWRLQTDAENAGGAGSVTQEALREEVAQFLDLKGHSGDVLKLFQGAVERVGALVSRVQGMLEFEVQPLREYFAGKYLYETAPYSTLTNEQAGSRPQRFDELIRRPYWANVARFFAGCYNSGELASLLTSLRDLGADVEQRATGHGLQMALLLLSDWVFSQEPRVVKAVIDFVTEEPNLRLLVAGNTTWEDQRVALPEKCGRTEFGEACLDALCLSDSKDYIRRLGIIVQMNANPEKVFTAWDLCTKGDELRWEKAVATGAIYYASKGNLEKLYQEFGFKLFVKRGQIGLLDEVIGERALDLLEYMADNLPDEEAHYAYRRTESSEPALFRSFWMIHPGIYRGLSYGSQEAPFEQSVRRFTGMKDITVDIDAPISPPLLSDFASASARILQQPISALRSRLDVWSDLVESGRRTWGDRPVFYTLAAMASGIKSNEFKGAGFSNLFDAQAPLVERSRYARLKRSVAWWTEAFEAATSQADRFHLSLMAFSWAPGPVINSLSLKIDDTLQNISDEEYKNLSLATSYSVYYNPGGVARLPSVSADSLIGNLSYRSCVLLSHRLVRRESDKVVLNVLKNYVGHDQTILDFGLFHGVLMGRSSSTIWKTLADFAEKNELFRVASGFEARQFGPSSMIPVGISKRIINDVSRYPIVMLEAAEAAMGPRVAGSLSTMGQLAAMEQWQI